MKRRQDQNGNEWKRVERNELKERNGMESSEVRKRGREWRGNDRKVV